MNSEKSQFVDREAHLKTFKEAVNYIGQKEFNVLVYHGIAGIGKTSLMTEFSNYLNEYNSAYDYQKVIWASIDLQYPDYREKNNFLIALEKKLQKTSTKRFLESKLYFTSFETAYDIYLKKAYLESSLRKENYLLFEGDNDFDGLLGAIDQVPHLNLVPNTLRILKKTQGHLRKLWAKIEDSELSELQKKNLHDIEKRLTYFWIKDLNNYLEDNSKYVVFFIDTYDVLRENYSLENWIKNELIPYNLLQKVLWVIFNREALFWDEIKRRRVKWSEYLTQYPVKELDENYCIEYLETRGILMKSNILINCLV